MIQQILYGLGCIVLIPFLPILIVMGKKVRKNVPELPEASENITGSIKGNHSEIRLLTLGESTIAGVGVTDHKDGITGQIAQKLYDLSKKTMYWQVLAHNGYTAEKVNTELVPLFPTHQLDIIVIGLGGNETFQFNSPLKFKKHLILTIKNIQKRQPQAKIIIANMPPVGEFPAFPWLFKKILGSLIDLHAAVIKDLPQRFENVFYMDEKITFKTWIKRTEGNLTVDDFFSDGIHPSAVAYGIWGKEVALFIKKNVF